VSAPKGSPGTGPETDKSPLSGTDALAFLQSRRTQRPDPARESRRSAYLQAASVLAGINDIKALNPLGSVARAPNEAFALLKNDLVDAPTAKFAGPVTLTTEARKAGLSALGSPGAMLNALAANPSERTGPIQEQFERYLQGNSLPIEQQTLEQLTETLQALLWLDGLIDGLPAIDDVRTRIEYLRLLQPAEALAGDDVFRGRSSELKQLRDYVGVVEPKTLLARTARKVIEWTKLPEQPALSIHGPGGVGKSALVARFVLEHTRLLVEERVPFAYLDLDRPALDISDPLALTAEMVRQINLQFDGFQNLYDFVLKNVKPLQPVAKIIESTTGSPPVTTAEEEADPLSDPRVVQDRAGKSFSIMTDLFGILMSRFANRPYLVVIDSFEVAQYRGEARATPFWDVLRRIQERAPFLRVVISGRAPVMTLTLAGRLPLSLEVGDLDRDAAIAFLQARGVGDENLAKRLVSQVGYVPLSLKLVAELVRRDPEVSQGNVGITGNSRFWFSVSGEVIQGQLFTRILGHIHNAKVRRLAHPGLTLRRITSDSILNILNVPCELDLKEFDEAQDLFDELSRETSLVTRLTDEDNRPTLLHRPELRRIMLKLLQQKAPAQVVRIHNAAIAWYSQEQTLRARAECLYHQLQLGQSITAEQVKDPEIRFSLQTSLEELPLQSQVLLASFGFTVGADVLNRATQEEYERYLTARVEEHLSYGQTSAEEARKLIWDTVIKLDHPSPLYQAAARVCAQLGQVNEVQQWLERGLEQAAAAGDTDQALALTAEKCWQLRNATVPSPDLPALLDTLADYSARHENLTYTMQHALQGIELAATSGTLDPSDPRIVRLLALVPMMDAEMFWDLLPAFAGSPVLERLGEPDTVVALGKLVSDPSSVFDFARLPDQASNLALQALLSHVSQWGAPGYDANQQFVTPMRLLYSSWPFRVLRVRPGYGFNSAALSEAR
jgi:hypothetical protein